MKSYWLISLFVLLYVNGGAQLFIDQPKQGFGSSDYTFDSVTFKYVELDKIAQNYWLFEPVNDSNKPLNVVVFTHGYSAKNPGVYGAWIEHLTKKGNIVIFPRYQYNFTTTTHYFTGNAATAVKHAVNELKTNVKYQSVNTENAFYVGHSYGGVISANMALKYKEFELPKPIGLMMCNPGTGGFNGGRYRYKKYAAMDTTIPIIMIDGEKDRVVKGRFPKKLYKYLKTDKNKIAYITQLRQKTDSINITAYHNACLAPDDKYNSITNSIQIRKGLKIGKVSAVDYFMFWKLADELMDYGFNNKESASFFNLHDKKVFLGSTAKGAIVPVYFK